MHIRLVFAQWGESKFPNTSAILYIEEATPHYYLPQILKKQPCFEKIISNWAQPHKGGPAYDVKIYVSIFSNECCWFLAFEV